MSALRRVRKPALFAVTALAALSLTACGPADGKDDALKSVPSASEEQGQNTTDVKGGESGGKGEARASTERGDSAGKGQAGQNGGAQQSDSGGSGAAEDVPCTGATVKAEVSQPSRPINHLLIKITNTGSKRCDAYYAPALRFDEDQAATRELEDSQPQAVVSLNPGESAYAGVGLTGEPGGDTHLRDASNLEVHFKGRDESEPDAGHSVNLALPDGTKVDDNAFVTYWQTDPSVALSF
ncbi:DUF4232 domain-containing protein [Streptomyces catenulae]|uniref:DUF4232 domain-containing protein n=1 Tax=Streptomyces catenulae TaxID=66875 RepID=A0ABV2Z7U6_9ACTN|nr:DUF4232 domain-containing protein [Streptomyces catenulae]